MIPARYAPVISAIPNNSAKNARARQNANAKTGTLLLCRSISRVLISRQPLEKLLDSDSSNN